MTNTPEGLQKLHCHNSDIISRLYGSDFLNRSKFGELSAIEAVEANEVLSDEMYGLAISSLIRNREYRKLLNVRDEMFESLASPELILDGLDLDRIGLVLIRPELLSSTGDCKKLLLDNELDILLSKRIKINLDQYLSLYPHAVATPNTYYDFPTRTLNYIHQDLELIIVCNRLKPNVPSTFNVSNFLSKKIRGVQGTFTPGTLRGDIAFNTIKSNLDLRYNNIIYPNAAIALDPIGTYRHLAGGDIPSNKVHETVEIPLLFYAGQGVHIPNQDEIKRDLRILCNQEDLLFIAKQLAEHDD